MTLSKQYKTLALLFFTTPLFLYQCVQATSASEETVEEITVIAQKSLRSFRMTVIAAELKYYEIYNALNDDKEFDISCRVIAPTGSRIKQRECLPNFVRTARAEESKRLVLKIAMPSADRNLRKNQKLLLEKMEAITKGNPELLTALYHLSDSKQRYEEERKERFEDSWIVY